MRKKRPFSPELARHVLANCSTFISLNTPVRPFALTDSPQRGHVMVVGQPGSGKTTTLSDILRMTAKK
ncbi:hypothetical protein NG99_22410 [Erwinia typographi]|uniref:Uncharacterized protein n=1 Tax=Erwinia typographi TaxID=371042 RepID=A0A0A3YMC6_9GAMM|nr:hypothetical protein NG99_22410 [Erwinia typographi]